MKGVFVILDGVADQPCAVLGGKTPLEYAKTPNLDFLAEKSRIDYCFTVKEGVAPESSTAILSLLGYDPNAISRGSLQAIGAGIPIKNGDLALRANFATIDNLKDKNVLDRRAGRTVTWKEAKALAQAVNEQVKLPFKFQFYPTIHHRGVLVFRGGFSDNITNIDQGYGHGIVKKTGETKLVFSKPMDDSEEDMLSAELVNNFVTKSYEVLNNHPVNIARAKKGLFPANCLLLRDAGSEIIRLKRLKGKWLALGYIDLEKGIARVAGMNVYSFKYPRLYNLDVYSCLYQGLKRAVKNSIKMIKRKKSEYDYFYIHFKETDTPGHDNKPLDKVKMIEFIDKTFFRYIRKIIRNNKLIVTADHITACRQKAHTEDPVPVLIYPHKETIAGQRFTENIGLRGRKIYGQKLLDSNFFSKK